MRSQSGRGSRGHSGPILKAGLTIAVTAGPSVRRASGTAPPSSLVGRVLEAFAGGVHLVRLEASLSPGRARAAAQSSEAPRPRRNSAAPAPPPTATPLVDCRDCVARRLTGFHLYTKARWSAIAEGRRSDAADFNRQLGQQWRRLTLQGQRRYHAMAEQANAERAAPLCRSSYQRFAAQERTKMKAKNPRLSASLVERHLAARWKTMPYAQRVKYSVHTPKAQSSALTASWAGSSSPEWPMS